MQANRPWNFYFVIFWIVFCAAIGVCEGYSQRKTEFEHLSWVILQGKGHQSNKLRYQPRDTSTLLRLCYPETAAIFLVFRCSPGTILLAGTGSFYLQFSHVRYSVAHPIREELPEGHAVFDFAAEALSTDSQTFILRERNHKLSFSGNGIHVASPVGR